MPFFKETESVNSVNSSENIKILSFYMTVSLVVPGKHPPGENPREGSRVGLGLGLGLGSRRTFFWGGSLHRTIFSEINLIPHHHRFYFCYNNLLLNLIIT